MYIRVSNTLETGTRLFVIIWIKMVVEAFLTLNNMLLWVLANVKLAPFLSVK